MLNKYKFTDVKIENAVKQSNLNIASNYFVQRLNSNLLNGDLL